MNAVSCTVSAGTCLRSFFEYYGFSFDFENHCISVYTNGVALMKVRFVISGVSVNPVANSFVSGRATSRPARAMHCGSI